MISSLFNCNSTVKVELFFGFLSLSNIHKWLNPCNALHDLLSFLLDLTQIVYFKHLKNRWKEGI